MKLLVAAAAALAALAFPVAAMSSGSDAVHVAGSGFGTGGLAGDHVEVGAVGDLAGTFANGHIELEGSVGTQQLHESAAVSCVRAFGNRAVVVGRLAEPLTIEALPGLVFTGAAVAIEDNGPPVGGQPVDRMADFVLREETMQAVCNTDLVFAFLAIAEPIESGNFVVND